MAWVVAVTAAAASAQEPPAAVAMAQDATGTAARSPWSAEAWLTLGTPAALQTGLASGFGVAATRGDVLRWGAGAGFASATEWSPSWAVTHWEFRGRLTARWQKSLGAGVLFAGASAGATVVHEYALLDQSWRTNEGKVERRHWAVRPAAEAEIGAGVRLFGDYGLLVAFGPAWPAGDNAVGFAGRFGLGWWP